MAQDCIFCAIAAGQISANVIDEDALTISFLDIAPSTRGHALVIPRRHSLDLWDVSAEDFAAVTESARRLAVRLRDRLAPAGINLINSSRPAAWQTVFHLHVHVIPRYEGDGLHSPFAPAPADPDELAALAAELR